MLFFDKLENKKSFKNKENKNKQKLNLIETVTSILNLINLMNNEDTIKDVIKKERHQKTCYRDVITIKCCYKIFCETLNSLLLILKYFYLFSKSDSNKEDIKLIKKLRKQCRIIKSKISYIQSTLELILMEERDNNSNSIND